jgi:glycosyltransferase involved in cell wall biosynthesis
MKLHIVSPDIREGDAVGNHCIYLAKGLRAAGIETALYAQRHSPMEEPVLSLQDLMTNCRAEDTLLISFSTYQPQLPALLRLPCRKVVYFHGVTPVELLLDHDPVAAYWSSKALLQLPQLALCDKLIANSQWNLDDLLGRMAHPPAHEQLAVIPPVTPDLPIFQQAHREPPDNAVFELIVVGRVAPHKKIEWAIDIVGTLVSKGYGVHLKIIGSALNLDYLAMLQAAVKTQHLENHVHMVGQVSQAALHQAFQEADALLITSEHEGFCIPVLEAMHLGLPTVIRSGTAASEVAGDAGLFFSTPSEGAQQIQRLLERNISTLPMVNSGSLRAHQLLRESSPAAWLRTLQIGKKTAGICP